MLRAKKFVYAKKFEGEPNPSNFRLEEEVLPELKDDEILCQAEFLSVDPYMRIWMDRYPINSLMVGRQIAKVLESRNPKYPVGSYIRGSFGWRTHTVVKPPIDFNAYEQKHRTDLVDLLADFENLPRSLAIGYLGHPGHSAYFGLLEICKPQPGETVVVTAAAGAVGSLVGQIAKIKGCRVIGFAGSDDKCGWIKKELGFDFAYNYKTADISKSLNEAAPEGIDCYFDNVGGEISSVIIGHMKHNGRISVCGSISANNATDVHRAPILQKMFVLKELKMEGFMVYRWTERFPESFAAISKWIQEGKIKYQETVTKGFENMPAAFMEMLKGKNFGKAIIEI